MGSGHETVRPFTKIWHTYTTKLKSTSNKSSFHIKACLLFCFCSLQFGGVEQGEQEWERKAGRHRTGRRRVLVRAWKKYTHSHFVTLKKGYSTFIFRHWCLGCRNSLTFWAYFTSCWDFWCFDPKLKQMAYHVWCHKGRCSYYGHYIFDKPKVRTNVKCICFRGWTSELLFWED